MKNIISSSKSYSTLRLMTLILLTLLCLGAMIQVQAQSQWTSNGNNISNTNSGNVGVGTSNPLTKLEVVGAATIDSDGTGLLLNNAAGANRARTTVSGTNTTALLGFDVLDSSGGGWRNVLNLNGSGNVGMGTISPVFDGNSSKYLTVDGGSGTFGSFGVGGNITNTTSAVGQMAFINTNLSGTERRIATIVGFNDGATNSGALNFWTASGGIFSSPRMTILSNGNVGIGTMAPDSALHVSSGTLSAYPKAYGSQTTWTSAVFSNNYDATLRILHSGAVSTLYTDNATQSVNFSTNGANNSRLFISGGGNVGIGKSNPTEALDVVGNIAATGNISAKYQDVAEWVPATHALRAGTVVVLNPDQSNQVMASATAYDTRVAGVVSERPGIALGEASKDKVLVATTGRVKVKVDATRAPVQIGDLLVTSEREGYAMKSEPILIGNRKIHAPGTLIGKALEPLEKGTGEILVLLSLQ